MSKNKNNRNHSYNNNMNVGNTIVEDMPSSVLEMSEELSVDNIEPEVVEIAGTVKEECEVEQEPEEVIEHMVEPECAAEVETCDVIESVYTIATDLIDGSFIGKKATEEDFIYATKIANEQTKITGEIHHVYDPSGEVVFSAKKKLVLLSYKKRGNNNANWYT